VTEARTSAKKGKKRSRKTRRKKGGRRRPKKGRKEGPVTERDVGLLTVLKRSMKTRKAGNLKGGEYQRKKKKGTCHRGKEGRRITAREKKNKVWIKREMSLQ